MLALLSRPVTSPHDCGPRKMFGLGRRGRRAKRPTEGGTALVVVEAVAAEVRCDFQHSFPVVPGDDLGDGSLQFVVCASLRRSERLTVPGVTSVLHRITLVELPANVATKVS